MVGLNYNILLMLGDIIGKYKGAMMFYGISQSTADSIFGYSNFALALGAALVLAGTMGAIYSGGIRERYSNERIAKNEAETARAQADAAQAQAEAAKSKLLAAEVERQNIDLKMKFSNRRINEKQHEILKKELVTHASIFNMETMGDPESGLFAADILSTLTEANWKVDSKTFPLGVIWTGLVIFNTADPAALHLANAFKIAEIPFLIGNEMRDKVTIMVGGKPPVF